MKTLILLSLLSTSAWSKELITVKVKGLVCSLCKESLEEKFKKNTDVKSVEVNLDEFWVKIVSMKKDSVSAAEINSVLGEAGYLIDKVERNSCEKC